MSFYNYKVVAELRNDLTDIQRDIVLKKIKELQTKFEIAQIDDKTYCKAGVIEGHNDFGAVSFFFFSLKDIKEFFYKLEYHDLWEGNTKIAV